MLAGISRGAANMLTLSTYPAEEWIPAWRLRRELARACGWYPAARLEERCWRLCPLCPPAARYFCRGEKRADSCRGLTGSPDSSRSVFCFWPPWFPGRAEVLTTDGSWTKPTVLRRFAPPVAPICSSDLPLFYHLSDAFTLLTAPQLWGRFAPHWRLGVTAASFLW